MFLLNLAPDQPPSPFPYRDVFHISRHHRRFYAKLRFMREVRVREGRGKEGGRGCCGRIGFEICVTET